MEVSELEKILMECYKKLKSYVYYTNNLTHIKYKILDFEMKKNFEYTFKKIAKAIINENDEFFNDLIYKVDLIPQIKKIKSTEKNQNIVLNEINNGCEIVVEKVNFFIDMPIELYIVDTFWTILFGKCINDKGLNLNINDLGQKPVAANTFDYGLFTTEEGIDGIDFTGLKLYKPYFKNYQDWKKGAIEKSVSLYNNNESSTIVSLDLTSFYYTINLKFDELKALCNIKGYNFQYETSIIEKIITTYAKKLSKIKTEIKENILPIVMICSGVLSNYYLLQFDDVIKGLPSVEYYSRYVDDILIVISGEQHIESAVDFLLPKFDTVFLLEDDKIKLKFFKDCYIQKEKIKIFYISSTGSKAILDSLQEEIPDPSEGNLVPNIENADLNNFFKNVYNLDEKIIKLRDKSGPELNKYKLFTNMSNYVLAQKNTKNNFKNTVCTDVTNNCDKNESLDQILIFFDNEKLFEFWDKWDKIFEFIYFLPKSSETMEKIVKRIENVIKNQISIDDSNQDSIIRVSFKNDVLSKLKKVLMDRLIYALGCVFALRKPQNVNNPNYSMAIKFIDKIKNANFINYNLVSIPLVNYMKKFNDSKFDLYDIQESDIEECINDGKNVGNRIFDNHKVKYSPRFIHLDEYMICRYLMVINNLNDKNLVKQIEMDYNKLFKINNNLYFNVENEKYDKYILQKINYNYSYEEEKKLNEIYIALANVNLKKHNIIDENKKIELDKCKSIENKKIMSKLLNDSEKKADFIVFPELYLPYEWLDHVMKFSRKTGIGIITGIKYLEKRDGNRKLINAIACILPFQDKNKYKYSSLIIREKNDYSPEEILNLKYNEYEIDQQNTSFNFIINWNNIKFSVFNCFELTDITARSLLKSKVDIIFTPQFNRDIAYFSNIIESACKDDGCFIVQVNSSHIGDTRIVGPFHHNYANICSISGGELDTIHIGKINISEYKDYITYEKEKYVDGMMNEYDEELKEKEKQSEEERKVKAMKKKYKRSSARLHL